MVVVAATACADDDSGLRYELTEPGCDLDAHICQLLDSMSDQNSRYYVTTYEGLYDRLAPNSLAELDRQQWVVLSEPEDDLFLDTPTPTPTGPDTSTVGPAPGPAAGYGRNGSM